MPITDQDIEKAFPQNIPAEPLGSGNTPAHWKTDLVKRLRDGIEAGDGPLTATTYANGQMTSYTVGGVTTTLTYDGQGRLVSTTANGVTKTLTYNPDGTLASFQ